MDRLAAFFHWSDTQALEQAIKVARDQEIDMAEIRQWSQEEGALDKFEIFARKIAL